MVLIRIVRIRIAWQRIKIKRKRITREGIKRKIRIREKRKRIIRIKRKVKKRIRTINFPKRTKIKIKMVI